MAADKKIRRNREIRALEVLVITDDGDNLGKMTTEEAVTVAQERGLDLVEVSPMAEPPVCRIMDYGKYAFERNKAGQAARKKAKKTQLKEIKFRPGTDVGDYDVKLRKLREFLDEGDKTKVTVRFRGREMAHQELGLELLAKVEADLDDISAVEQRPKLEGRQMLMILGPKKT